MDIVFFGSSQFAVPALKALLDSKHRVLCVITQPDRIKGRGWHVGHTAVKDIALGAKLAVEQPQNVNRSPEVEYLKKLNADVFVVADYGQILSKEILDIPRTFCLNMHASLLPKYRGAAPINWALINGEKVTGVTVIKLIEEMDAGPVIMQRDFSVSDEDSVIGLEEKLAQVAAELLLLTLDAVENNAYALLDQDSVDATYAPKLKKTHGLIHWCDSARDICNRIRGCAGWPGTFTYAKNHLLKIHSAKMSLGAYSIGADVEPGTIIEITKDFFSVASGDGAVVVREVQLEGKKRMAVSEFLQGHKVTVGDLLSEK